MHAGTSRRLRLSGLGISLAALALAATGCAGTSGTNADGITRIEPVAATRSVTSSASTSTGSASLSKQAAAFTACVRENGVPNFPGVTITADGQIQLNVSGSGVDVFSTEYQKAVAACQHLLPAGSKVPGDPSPATPSAPDLGFSCSGTCPKTPSAPEPPR